MTDYEEAGWNMVANIALIPKVESVVWISDASIIKQIVNDKVAFPKPVERYQAIKVFGPVRASFSSVVFLVAHTY